MDTELSKATSKRIIWRRCAATLASATLALWLSPGTAPAGQGTTWTTAIGPNTVAIKGGPWTLEQSGAANGLKTAGYCTTAGVQIGNPGTERMEPYYFPFITGTGLKLQGYFDYRPKDTDEAVVAASSTDGGATWIFQDKVLELSQAPARIAQGLVCPSMANKEPDGEKDAVCTGFACQNADNGDDDGQGHQFVMSVNGNTFLYTLTRSVGHIDHDQLVIHPLSPIAGHPLNGVPSADDTATDTTPAPSPAPAMTTGLLNPDGILGVVPGSDRDHLRGEDSERRQFRAFGFRKSPRSLQQQPGLGELLRHESVWNSAQRRHHFSAAGYDHEWDQLHRSRSAARFERSHERVCRRNAMARDSRHDHQIR